MRAKFFIVWYHYSMKYTWVKVLSCVLVFFFNILITRNAQGAPPLGPIVKPPVNPHPPTQHPELPPLIIDVVGRQELLRKEADRLIKEYERNLYKKEYDQIGGDQTALEKLFANTLKSYKDNIIIPSGTETFERGLGLIRTIVKPDLEMMGRISEISRYPNTVRNKNLFNDAISSAQEKGEPFIASLFEQDPITRRAIQEWFRVLKLEENIENIRKIIRESHEGMFFEDSGRVISVPISLGNDWVVIGHISGSGQFLFGKINYVGALENRVPLIRADAVEGIMRPERLLKARDLYQRTITMLLQGDLELSDVIVRLETAKRILFDYEKPGELTAFEKKVKNFVILSDLQNPSHEVVVRLFYGLNMEERMTSSQIAQWMNDHKEQYEKLYKQSGVDSIIGKANKIIAEYETAARKAGEDTMEGFLRAVQKKKLSDQEKLEKARVIVENFYNPNYDNTKVLSFLLEHHIIDYQLFDKSMVAHTPLTSDVIKQLREIVGSNAPFFSQSVREFIRELKKKIKKVEELAEEKYGSATLDNVKLIATEGFRINQKGIIMLPFLAIRDGLSKENLDAATIIFSGRNSQISPEKIAQAKEVGITLGADGLRALRDRVIDNIREIEGGGGIPIDVFREIIEDETHHAMQDQGRERDKIRNLLKSGKVVFRKDKSEEAVKLLFGLGEDEKQYTPEQVANKLEIPYTTVVSIKERIGRLLNESHSGNQNQ